MVSTSACFRLASTPQAAAYLLIGSAAADCWVGWFLELAVTLTLRGGVHTFAHSRSIVPDSVTAYALGDFNAEVQHLEGEHIAVE